VGLTTFPRQRDRRAPHVEIADVTGEDELHYLRNRINASKAPPPLRGRPTSAMFAHCAATQRAAGGSHFLRIVL
jgi:hypothetical protein